MKPLPAAAPPNPAPIVRINPGLSPVEPAAIAGGSLWARLASLDATLDLSVTSGPIYTPDGVAKRQWRVVIRPPESDPSAEPVVVIAEHALDALTLAVRRAEERGWPR